MRPGYRWARWPLVLACLAAAFVLWDYGIQKNFDTVVPGRLYRSGQPSEQQLEDWIHDYGLKAILSLRHGVPPYERRLADRYGLKLYNVPFSARTGLGTERWRKIRAILTDQRNWPLLVHCRGGGDRTGIVMALYRIDVQGWPLEKALREMERHYHVSLRYPALQEELRQFVEDAQENHSPPETVPDGARITQ